MTMNVTLPNGTVIQNVPDGTTKEQVMQRAISAGLATAADFQQAAQNPPSQVQQQATQPSQPQQPQYPLGVPVRTAEADGFVNGYNADGIVVASARIGTPDAAALQQVAQNGMPQSPAPAQQVQQPQSTAPAQPAAPAPAQAPSANQAASSTPATTPTVGSTPQNTDSILAQTVQGVDEAARAIAQGAVNVANIVPEVGDAIQSAGAWAGEKIGLGDGTYTPAARFSLPQELQPQTEAGKVAANVIPYFVPGVGAERAATAAGTAATGGLAERAATGITRYASDAAPGALAQNSQRDNPTGLATDVAAGVAGGVIAKGVSAALSPIVSRVAQAISNRGTPAIERAATVPPSSINPGMTPQQAVNQAIPEPIPTQSSAGATELGNVAQAANRATNQGATQREAQEFARQVVPDEAVLDSARRLGLEESLTPGMYSQNPAYRAFEVAQAVTPGTKMFQSHREAISRLGQEADAFINDFGGSLDKSFVNHQVRSEYNRLIDGLKRESDKIYNKISTAIPKRTVVEPKDTVNLIEDVADDVGGLEALKNTYPQMAKTLSQLQSASADGATPVTYGRLDAIRQQVGQALGSKMNQGPYGDVDRATLSRLYDALTSDQGRAVSVAGLSKEWDAAKNMVNLRKQVEVVAVKNIGKEMNGDVVPPIQQAITQMAQGGGKNFRKLVNDLPDTVKDAVVLTAMNKAFTSFARSPGQQLGVPGFVKWYNGMLRNKENMQALSNAIGYPAARRLHNIYVVANGINRIGSEKVYSKTQIDRMMANFDKDGGLVSKIYGMGRAAAKAEGITSAMHLPGVGTAHAIISTLSAPKVNRTVAADELMASPQFRDMTKKMFEPGKARQAAEQALENSKIYKNWLITVTPEERSRLIRQGIVGVLTAPDVTGSQDNFADTGS